MTEVNYVHDEHVVELERVSLTVESTSNRDVHDRPM